MMTQDNDIGAVELAEQYVANARSLLEDFEDVDPDVQKGSLEHAINELELAGRELVDYAHKSE